MFGTWRWCVSSQLGLGWLLGGAALLEGGVGFRVFVFVGRGLLVAALLRIRFCTCESRGVRRSTGEGGRLHTRGRRTDG